MLCGSLPGSRGALPLPAMAHRAWMGRPAFTTPSPCRCTLGGAPCHFAARTRGSTRHPRWQNKDRSTLALGGRPRCIVQAATAPAETGELPAQLKKIVSAFQMVPDPKLKYQQLLVYGKRLPPMAPEDHNEDNKVRGCVSQVWVKPALRDGHIFWDADSDSALTKGLAALLVQGLAGCTPEEVVRIPPDWMAGMGLAQSLTPSRNNGFLNMFRLMQAKALALLAEQHRRGGSADAQQPGPSAGSGGGVQGLAARLEAAAPPPATAGADTGSTGTPVRDAMEQKLSRFLKPIELHIADESAQHAGHAGSRMTASGSGETHFRVAIVSPEFQGLPTVKRHRLVYQILQEELAGPVHALSLDTKTPAEVAKT